LNFISLLKRYFLCSRLRPETLIKDFKD